MRIRHANRRAGPIRVTQRGTRTTYPGLNRRKLAALRDRYAGTGIRDGRP